MSGLCARCLKPFRDYPKELNNHSEVSAEPLGDKRYLVFTFAHYYPSGGMFDLDGSYDCLDSARDRVKILLGTGEHGHYEEATIYDRVKGVEVDNEDI
jgi:hypothetical protein